MADYAANTQPWYSYRDSIISVVIGNGVTRIGTRAFQNCSNHTSVTISTSVATIGDYTFSYTDTFSYMGLTTITVAPDNPNFIVEDGVLFNRSKTTLIQYPSARQGAYTIPDGITAIGNYAFISSKLTFVTIPNDLISIGYDAFNRCYALSEITIPNSVTSIDRNAFFTCTGLTSVTIGSNVDTIGYGAFTICTSLLAIDVVANNTKYASENGVLFNKSKTTLIQYPAGRQGAYSIPGSVARIEDNVFRGSSGLTSVTIPGSVTTIGGQAFRSCSNLTSITSMNELPPTVGGNSFVEISPSCCLYVSADALTAYTNASGWSSIPYKLALSPTVYTITFDALGGTAVGDQVVQLGQKVQQFADPSREGYTFLGWYTDAQGTQPWNFNTAPTASMTLYAKWQLAPIVSFDVQGGDSPTPATQTVQDGQRVQQPSTPFRTGYAFGGWYREATCITQWNFSTDVVHYSMTLYAQWLLLRTVEFNSMGGNAVPSQQVAQGRKVQQPANPTRASYTFSGWYKDLGCTQLWDFGTDVVTANLTLYAKWISSSAIIDTVTFNSQDGSAVLAQKVARGGTAAQPGDPVKAGFTFGGWYTNQACTVVYNFSSAVNGNIMLYALWQCTAWFNPNGGSSVPEQVVRVGSKLIKPTPDPRHRDYSFVKWCSDLCLATEWDFDSDTVQGDMILYGRWDN